MLLEIMVSGRSIATYYATDGFAMSAMVILYAGIFGPMVTLMVTDIEGNILHVV